MAESLQQLTAAAKNGDAEALCALGLRYETGDGVEMDRSRAASLYREAAEAGHAQSQCNLGHCYYRGIGVKANGEKAVYWFQKAAKQGWARAIGLLGLCYEKGFGVDQDQEEAAYYYRKAHEGGAMSRPPASWGSAMRPAEAWRGTKDGQPPSTGRLPKKAWPRPSTA